MKQVEKYIYIVLAFILVAVIASGVTYIVMKDDNSQNNVQDSNPNKVDTDKENNDKNDTDDNKDNEQIKLSEEELEKYISYIPKQITKEVDEYYNYDIIYSRKKTLAKDLKNSDLLSQVLYNLSGGLDEEEIVASYDKAKSEMQKMYNIPLADYKNTYDENGNFVEYAAMYGGYGYAYKNGNFIIHYVASGYEGVTLIDDYKATSDELVIYSYSASYNSMYNNDVIYDYYKNEELKISLPSDGYNTSENVTKYIKEHKTEFTKYKSTFKKNDTGYYWFSTEVV